MWDLEPSQQCENFFGIIILQFVGYPPSNFKLCYVNQEFPDVQARFRKGRGTRDQIANIYWII